MLAPAPGIPDEVLVERCQRGDQASWSQLFQRFWDLLFQAVCRQLQHRKGCEAQAEAIVEAVLSSLWEEDCRCLGQFDPGRGTLGLYLGVLAARRVQLEFRRLPRRCPAITLHEGLPEPGYCPEPLGEDAQLAEFAASLSPQERRFVDYCLKPAAEAGPCPFSPANGAKLKQRVRRRALDPRRRTR